MKKVALLLALLFSLGLAGCGSEENINNEEIVVPKDIDVTYGKGNANAKVVITEYSDYQCPFCARFTLDQLPLLQNDYLETNKVRFIFKDYPIPNHKYAQMEAQATYCAGEQNEDFFWKMHVSLFENQKDITKEDLIARAESMGVNSNVFRSCLETEKYKNLVLRNRQDGIKAGVTGTPTLFINDQKITGIQPYENLVKIIETEINKATKTSAQ
jgi:protein-disulfide isomerase